MATPLLTTKLYIPPPLPNLVSRPRLVKRLDEGLRLSHRLTLISAPAGFGKTTLLSEWVQAMGGATPPRAVTPGPSRPACTWSAGTGGTGTGPGLASSRAGLARARTGWLSLDEEDNDLARFLAYVVAALQTVAGNVGRGLLAALQSPGAVNVEAVLTTLLNEIAGLPDDASTAPRQARADGSGQGLVLVLDDYHVIESQPVDKALTFILDHLPVNLHLVIATRTDPTLPLSRLRARGQLTELREADLRFTTDEAAAFLKQVVRLPISPDDVRALEKRTEGWITGLQLAAVAMQGLEGREQIAHFIHGFGGSHHYVIDYLVDEVLDQQTPSLQEFLLQTSILDRMVVPLCNAVTDREDSQAILEALEHANLFIVPLDNERRWYRYHHLFADLLQQRLHQSAFDVAELHKRASVWYEDNGLEIEAFHHAAAANDVERAERLIEGKGMPLHFRGAVAPVLRWLELLPKTVLDAHPLLWTTYASVLLVSGQKTDVEQELQAAEAALQGAEPVPSAVEGPNDKTRDLIGRIAAIRATLAANRYQVEAVIAQSRRALEYLHPDNLAFRTFTVWKLGYAYHIQGDRAAASRAYTEAISISQASENIITTIVATIGLGSIQETENQLYLSAETYRRALQLLGDQPLPVACEAHLGLARILYEWNDLEVAEQHCQQSIQLARQSENTDRFVACEVFLARLKRAQGDVASAAAILAEADQTVRRSKFVHRMPEVAATQVLTLLRQDDVAAAAHLAQTHNLPISQARVLLAQGDASAALAILEPFRQQMEAKGWQDERLKVMVLQAVALHAHGDQDTAMQLLSDALVLAEPGGFIRIFVDEGMPMAQLLLEADARGIMPDYTRKLLAAFEDAAKDRSARPTTEAAPSSLVIPYRVPWDRHSSLIEPLSQRELEILHLIAQGLSNREISERLFLALDTVKGHNRRIFDKLQVQRRTEAIARARELGLL